MDHQQLLILTVRLDEIFFTWRLQHLFNRIHQPNEALDTHKNIKVYGLYSLSKDALREERTPWLIKCQSEGNLSDVGHFNTSPHLWQLMAKHMDNNGRERPIIAKNL